jgi:predicted alpha/beta hydrolase
MTWRRILFCVIVTGTLVMGVSFAVVAQQAEATRVVDLTAMDGTHLKATYFAASKPGPGVLLLHQCNRQRKVWDDLAKQMAASGLNVLTLDFR